MSPREGPQTDHGQQVLPHQAPPLAATGPALASSGTAPQCTYCGEPSHWRSMCADLTSDLNACRVRLWQGEYYLPGSREKNPWDYVRGLKPSQSAEVSTLSGVGVEVRTVKSDEGAMFNGFDLMDIDNPKKVKGKEMTPGKKTATKLAK